MSDHSNPGTNGSSSMDATKVTVTRPASSVATAYAGHRQPLVGDSSGGISLWLVLHALRHWWKVATPLGLILGVTMAALVYYTYTPMYRASAWLRIRSRAPYIAFPDGTGSQASVRTEVQLITSPLVVSPAVAELLAGPQARTSGENSSEQETPDQGASSEGLSDEGGANLAKQPDPIDYVTRELKVTAVGGSELFTVSFIDPNRFDAARIVNKVVEEYLNLRSKQDSEQVQKVIGLLETELSRRALEVERLRENYRQLYEQGLGKDPFAADTGVTVTTVPNELQSLQTSLVTTQFDIELMKAQIVAMGGSIPGPSDEISDQDAGPSGAPPWSPGLQLDVPQGQIELELSRHPEVQDLKAKLAEKRTRLREYKSRLAKGVKDPLYVQLSQEIQADEEKLKELEKDLWPEVRTELAKAFENQWKARYENYCLMEKVLQERIERERANMVQYGGQTLELKFAADDLARAQNVFDLIASRITKLRTEQVAPAQVDLLRRATPPSVVRPVEPFPYKNLILAVLAGFCFPFGLAVLWERFRQRVSDARQLAQQSHLPVLGEVARLPVRTRVMSRSSSKRVGHNVRIFEESIDSLRTCLALSESFKEMRVFAVTSAANNEGKTSVAVQLAVSSARASGEVVLLIDGDMRSPDIHKVLGTSLNPGLAGVLAGDCTVENAILTDWSKQVHILPAGKLKGNSPHRLLGNGELKAVLDKVRTSYRYVIIDTPPILAAGEALVFAKAADGALICAMRDISRMDQVNMAHERLVAADGKPIGVILNGVPARQYAYRYGSYDYLRGGE